MSDPVEFKRIVLRLHGGRSDPASLRLAVDLAELLRLQLSALFVIDESLLAMAELPFIRELRSMGGGWHRLQIDQLAREMDLAARNARQLFIEAARSVQAATSFEIARGATARVLATVPQQGDILIITLPSSAAERFSEPFASLLESALKSAAHVMLIPDRVARTHGPIAALAMSPGDPCIDSAAAVAAAAGEDLIVVKAYGGDIAAGARSDVEAAAGTTARSPLAAPHVTAQDRRAVAALFGRLSERLVVMSRDAASGKFPPALIVSERRVPVLIDRPR